MFRGKKRSEKPILIHEVHDLWPKALIDFGGMKRYNPFVLLMQMGQYVSYRKADYVASTLEYSENYMKKHGLASGKFVYISNGISKEDWEKTEDIPEDVKSLLEKLKLEKKFIVGYFGGFAISNALDKLIDVAKLIKIPEIVFVLLGKGTEKERLQNQATKANLKNVYFKDPIPKNAIPSLLKYFDCAYLGFEKELEICKYGISLTKMYDAMMAGVPIVMAAPPVLPPVEKFQCGIRCDVNNNTELGKAIEQLYYMSAEEKKRLGDNGKRAIENNFLYEDLAKKYEALFPKNTKSIVLINHYAGSNSMGMDFRPYYLAREWVKRGYKVHILAAEYSHLRRKNPKVDKEFQKEKINSICYYWIKTCKYNGNGLKRAITMFQFVGKLFFKAKYIAKKLQPDVVITASTYPLDIFAAMRIRKYRRLEL